MTDIFNSKEASQLLEGKKILFLGGSLVRGFYKDLIWFTNSNTLINRNTLGKKGEERFPDFSETDANGEEENFKYKDQLHDCKKCPEDYKGATIKITTKHFFVFFRS